MATLDRATAQRVLKNRMNPGTARVYGITTDFVDSPDDKGFYIQQSDLDKRVSRVSRDIFPDQETLLAAYRSGRVDWEDWS